MKTKLFTLLLAVAASIGTMFASTKIGDLYYNLDATNHTAEVAMNSSASGEIIIPASVTYNSVSYSVTSIGSSAFGGCSGLTSVTIPNSVTSIGSSAFWNCTGLTSVTIPNSVTSIGEAAFYDCTGLTSVTIGNSVTSIGVQAFGNCTGLTSIIVASDNSNYCSVDGVLFNKDKTTLIQYPRGKQGAYTIPNSVTSIGSSAFFDCSSLTSVTIPNSVTSIGNSAFYYCSGLTAITIGNSVTSIGSSAFSGCSSLTSVTIPNSVTSIGRDAFYGCRALTSVTIGNSVTSIGDYAFQKCTGLTSVTIGNSVTSIGKEAFDGCSGLPVVDNLRYADTYLVEAVDKTLSSYTIKDGTRWIGYLAFYGCTGLTSVTIPNSVTSIGSYAFSGCSSLTSPVYNAHVFAFMPTSYSGAYTIPDGIESIAGGAFNKCYSLTSVTIPNSVTSIGNSAFEGCSSLTSVTIEAETPPTLGSDAFDNTNNCPIYVPCGTLEAYKTAWSYSSRITHSLSQECIYTISTTSVNPEWGTTAGGKSALYLDEVEISATANYGYHFVRWNDNNTSNPRTVSVTEDKTYTATFAKNVYSITKNAEHGSISGNSTAEYLDEVTLTANPDYGYHFSQWSDGNTDNPRTIVLASDTTFTAEFAKNTYSVSTTSTYPEWGTTAGDTAALYLDEVEISAIPNYGYYFERWNDGSTANPRIVSVAGDKTFTATFAKNVYSITKNAEHGTISGNSSAEYLDFVTLTVTPDYGYHFTQWSDGLKDNPRIFQITSDTTFTAEFAPDRVGTCGKDLALVWSYDPANKVLTIGNAGSFTENMQFGVEAPNEMEELVIGNSVTAIGENAFAGISTLKKVSIGESVKTIGEQAFYNCVNLETIFNYRPTPTNTYSNAFDGVDKFECVLYVLPNSIDMYKAAAVWRDFYYTYAIGAEEATVATNDVQVEPQDNAATLTWPTSNNAATYTIQITKDGVVFCTLIFNANGQLTGIAFAPSREGSHHAPAAIMTANGLQFTVTGLDSNTQYGYSVTAKDANDQTVATYSGEFTTTSEGTATGFEDVQGNNVQCTKVLHNGQIFILRGDKTYTLQGQEVK